MFFPSQSMADLNFIVSFPPPRLKAFFAYCKIQKRAEVRSFPYRYLYSIGIFATS